MGIYKGLILALRALPHVHDRLVLVGASFVKEVTASALERRRYRIELEKLFQPLVYLIAAREFRQHRFGVLVLDLDPGASLSAVLILEPAIRIGDVSSVNCLAYVINPCRWRPFRGLGRNSHHRRQQWRSKSSQKGPGHIPSPPWID